jgi:PBP1b-binding outer membrane lipoprotein LpoB
MKKLATAVLLIPTLIVVLSGCASGPSPEQQTREAEQQRAAERQQSDFRKGLPPVSNPGQGW